MTDRYEKIRKALEMGPTPGPWGLTELPRDIQRDGYKFAISRNGLGWWIAKVTHEANGGTGVANATYIAAADPATIAALLKERDALWELVSAIMDNRGKCFIPTLGTDTPDALLNWDERARAALADGEEA